jgi:hypothetical protein
MPSAFGSQPVRAPSLVPTQTTYPATFFQPGNRSIKCSWSQPHSCKDLDVVHHGVTMFVSIGEAGQHKKGRVRHGYYVTRSIAIRNGSVKIVLDADQTMVVCVPWEM